MHREKLRLFIYIYIYLDTSKFTWNWSILKLNILTITSACYMTEKYVHLTCGQHSHMWANLWLLETLMDIF